MHVMIRDVVKIAVVCPALKLSGVPANIVAKLHLCMPTTSFTLPLSFAAHHADHAATTEPSCLVETPSRSGVQHANSASSGMLSDFCSQQTLGNCTPYKIHTLVDGCVKHYNGRNCTLCMTIHHRHRKTQINTIIIKRVLACMENSTVRHPGV